MRVTCNSVRIRSVIPHSAKRRPLSWHLVKTLITVPSPAESMYGTPERSTITDLSDSWREIGLAGDDPGGFVDRLVGRINQNGGGENAPRPGDPMPPFVLPDETGRLIDLESLLSKGPVAVMFHRGHWCPYCRLNVRAVVQAQDQIRALGGQVVAIMPELQEFTSRFKVDSSAPFPVLTDLDNGYALSLNLAIWLGTEIQQLLSYQDLSNFHGNDGWMLPIPATFVVGRDGLVKARFVDPDFRKRMEIEDLIAALKGASREARIAS